MKKKFRIKKFNLRSVFFGALSLGIIPAVFQFFLWGINIMVTGDTIAPLIGIFIYCLFTPVIFGLMAVVILAGYNWFSPRIGQFEIEIEEGE